MLLHINKGQAFAPDLTLSFSVSLQRLCHTTVQLHPIPTVRVMTLEQEERMSPPRQSAALRAQQEQIYGSIYMSRTGLASINILFSQLVSQKNTDSWMKMGGNRGYIIGYRNKYSLLMHNNNNNNNLYWHV